MYIDKQLILYLKVIKLIIMEFWSFQNYFKMHADKD